MRDERHDPHRAHGDRRPVNGARRDGSPHRAVPFHGRDLGPGGRPRAPHGHHPGHGHDEFGEPLDLVAVQADDELINALAAGYPMSSGPGYGSGYGGPDRVTAVLAAWRAEVDSAPIPELLDVETAMRAIEAGAMAAGRPRRRGGLRLVPVAAAAAFFVITLGGVSVGSYSAEPNDVLFPITEVLFSERAESEKAEDRVEQRIELAKGLLAAGQSEQAMAELRLAEADLAAVLPDAEQVELVAAQDFLMAKAEETPDGVAIDPTAPLASDPSRKAPPAVADKPVVPAPVNPSTTAPSGSRDPGWDRGLVPPAAEQPGLGGKDEQSGQGGGSGGGDQAGTDPGDPSKSGTEDDQSSTDDQPPVEGEDPGSDVPGSDTGTPTTTPNSDPGGGGGLPDRQPPALPPGVLPPPPVG